MTHARYLVGDVFERMAELPDGSVDLVLTSPPFLALRSYLPADHPDKAKEIGSEPTPAAFLDTLLVLTAEWRRLLAPHGSICVELGDTYSGSGGAGGDYAEGGMREGQPKFRQGLAVYTDGRGNPDGMRDTTFSGANTRTGGGDGWPLAKSLCGIPHLYHLSLAYGRNVLRAPLSGRELLTYFDMVVADLAAAAAITGEPPPSATDLLDMMHQYLDRHEELGPTIEFEQWRVRNVVAWCRPNPPVGALGDKFRPATSYMTIACVGRSRYFDLDAVREPSQDTRPRNTNGPKALAADERETKSNYDTRTTNPAGAPPNDWWDVIERLLAAAPADLDTRERARYVREGLEDIYGPGDLWEIPTAPYPGSHYATFPPALCTRPIQAMCPAFVCNDCDLALGPVDGLGYCPGCGGLDFRRGLILDPFAGSGTTLAVATGHGRDAIGIDIDLRNADLARERVGLFLTVEDEWPATA